MQQIAFPLGSSDAYDSSEYIRSSSNSLAYKTISNWPTNWGVEPYSKTLIIQGPKSSGKTFLAKKWAVQSGALFIKKIHALTENMLTDHQAFIIDGFDSTWDEEKALHHFNTIHENGKYLLINSTRIPKIKLPDLASRIKSSNRIDIGMPDDELMQMLIFKLFSNYSIVISSEVINYLINILPREFSKIITSVKDINKFALQHKRKITVPLVKQALSIA
jgi:chromosomal replication initiation ATPase DnaA